VSCLLHGVTVQAPRTPRLSAPAPRRWRDNESFQRLLFRPFVHAVIEVVGEAARAGERAMSSCRFHAGRPLMDTAPDSSR